jgi:hypothetical protein
MMIATSRFVLSTLVMESLTARAFFLSYACTMVNVTP